MSTRTGRELLAFALLLALLAPTATGYGETVFNSNTIISGSGFDVQTNRRVGQSFAPSEAFIAYNVTLYVENVGLTQVDLLNVTIVTDAAGSPSTTILAWSERTRSGLGWLDFPLTPQPTLAAATTYWIVAASLSAPNEGYRWYHSNANVVAGESKIETGGGWGSPQVPDMVYVTYGIKLEPSIRVGMSLDRVSANPGDTFAYTVYLNNTGSRAAPNVWVNLSLPAGVTYVSDNAGPALGGVRTGDYNWSFPNVANGPNSYRVNARVDDFVPPGSLLTATVDLDYRESTGVRGPRSTATASIIAGLNPKPLYLAYDGTANQRDWLRPAPPGGAVSDFDGDGNTGLTVDKDSIPSTAPRWSLEPGFARPFRLRGNVTVYLYLDSKTPSETASLTFTLYDGGTTTILSRTVSVTFNAFPD
ncbi:MAG: DUF11 domain-containing protein, partial [Euryarchaeota archaeon]|nr:DUF11 domain-containing protein [Euryarchaeota archaeon]